MLIEAVMLSRAGYALALLLGVCHSGCGPSTMNVYD